MSVVTNISADYLLNNGFKEQGMTWSNGSTTLIDMCGYWAQVHIDPYTLRTTHTRIGNLQETIGPKKYKPVRDRSAQDHVKVNSVNLLPSHIVKKSEKWYQDTQTGKWILAERIKKQYILP